MSSATTPNISNTTTFTKIIDGEGVIGDGSNADNRNANTIPLPNIFSRQAIPQLLPRHRQLLVNSSYHDVQPKSKTWSSFNRRTSCEKNSVQSLGSRIKVSTTLGLLVLGLILSFCMLVKFATMGPSNHPFGDTSINNSVHGDQNRNGFNAGSGGDLGEELHEKQPNKHSKAKTVFDEEGRYIIEDYDALPTFSNFLPGVAGIYGKPVRCNFCIDIKSLFIGIAISLSPHHHIMVILRTLFHQVWSFYVNRGQGIASFGLKSKDFPIMEFHSANNAYQNTQLLGFRTFYQGRRSSGRGGKSKPFVVEPFDSARTRFSQYYRQGGEKDTDSIPINGDSANYPIRTMFIGSNELQIREVDRVNMIETNVTYFSLPEETFGAFVRRTTIANIDSDRLLHVSILDGLARIQPFGGKLNLLLKVSRAFSCSSPKAIVGPAHSG